MSAASEFLNSLEQDWSNQEASNLLKLYQYEGNGLQVWRALRELHEAKIPIPDSIISKFVAWSISLEGANNPLEVCKALELGGDSKVRKGLQRAKQIEDQYRLTGRVSSLMRLYKIGPIKAIQLVSRDTGESFDQVKKTYYDITSGKPKRKLSLHKNKVATSTLDSIMHGAFGR